MGDEPLDRDGQLERMVGTVCGWVAHNGIIALLRLVDSELSSVLYAYYRFRLGTHLNVIVSEYPDMAHWIQPQPVVCEQYGGSLVVLYSRQLFFELISSTLSLASVFRLQALYPRPDRVKCVEVCNPVATAVDENTGNDIDSCSGNVSVPGVLVLGGESNEPTFASSSSLSGEENGNETTMCNGSTFNEFLRAFKLQMYQARWSNAEGSSFATLHSSPMATATASTTLCNSNFQTLGDAEASNLTDYSLSVPQTKTPLALLRNDPIVQRSAFDSNLSTSVRSGLLQQPEFTSALTDYVTIQQQLIEQIERDRLANVSINETDASLVYRETTNLVNVYDRPVRQVLNDNLPGLGVPRTVPGQPMVPFRVLPLLLEQHAELYTFTCAVVTILDQAFVSMQLRHLSSSPLDNHTNVVPPNGRQMFLKRGPPSSTGSCGSRDKRARFKSGMDPCMASISVRIETGHDYHSRIQPRVDDGCGRWTNLQGKGQGPPSTIQYVGHGSGGSYGRLQKRSITGP